METPIQWLLDGPPWVEYRTRLDILAEQELNPSVQLAREKMLHHPLIVAMVQGLADWPGIPVNSHKKADLPMHKLAFLADLGLKSDDPGMNLIIDRILEYQSMDGPFQVRMAIPTAFGGSGKEILAWALCDSPITLYSLIKFGLADHLQVQKALDAQINMVRENGYPCLGSKEMGTFRGPGRKEDPCPFATLIMLKVFSTLPGGWDIHATQLAAKSLLDQWQNRSHAHPYMFYMGTDFSKLKAPLNWYDLLHVAEILSRFEALRSEQGLIEMVQLIRSKLLADGKIIPESIYMAWKDWDFGQKKEPSAWLTFLVHRILHRMDSVPQSVTK